LYMDVLMSLRTWRQAATLPQSNKYEMYTRLAAIKTIKEQQRVPS